MITGAFNLVCCWPRKSIWISKKPFRGWLSISLQSKSFYGQFQQVQSRSVCFFLLCCYLINLYFNKKACKKLWGDDFQSHYNSKHFMVKMGNFKVVQSRSVPVSFVLLLFSSVIHSCMLLLRVWLMSRPSNLEVNSADNQLALMRGQINIATVWVRRTGTLDDF